MSFNRTISSLINYLKQFNLCCERVFSIYDSKDFEKETWGNKHLDKVEGRIKFDNVSFKYDNKNVLDKMSFDIKCGETIAFVGKSGAGKTTILSLICKLFNIDSGHIYLDDNDIYELDKDSLRGNISIITQNPYIFNLSIRDNFKLIKSNLKEKEMISACKKACLHDFIKSLPNGYDTVVGEGGVTLSGGQRQRLAIARAFVQNTKLILFDEATSALDNETQANIKKTIDNMKGDFTILIVAHRLSTIKNADRILFVSDGKILDSGNHKYLFNNCKEYRQLYNSEIITKED
jgi:ABC-type multidrug transport system fused ATPase/permease subunit